MTKSKRILLPAAAVALCLGAGFFYRMIHPRAVEASAVEVRIDNFSYTPTPLVVKSGTVITWTNRDDIPHTVVEEENTFHSKVLDTDEKFTFTATKPGTYKYYCSIHPKMMAKVIVE